MIKKIIYFCAVLCIFLNNQIHATNYYLSNFGDNKNSGLSQTSPWKTIQKLNTILAKLYPGDSVLFERDGYFPGQINLVQSGSESNPIVFGAYGSGKNPIISGAIPVQNWTKYKPDIYKADIDTIAKNLFSNGRQMILARYPNSGFLKIKKSNSKLGFYDDQLTQPDDYWKGSIARIRTENWVYEYSNIKNFSKGNITLENATKFPITKDWGYYLDNNLKELDSPNEWYFESSDNGKGYLYLMAGKNQDVNDKIVEASVYDYGFFSRNEVSNLVIQNLSVKNQFKSGIWLSNKKSNIVIENCIFKGQFQTGIFYSDEGVDCEIKNCRFLDINGKAIFILESSKLNVSNNIFRNIGMIPGYGSIGDDYNMSSMVIFSDHSRIAFNYISNVGHDAITCHGTGNVVEKNIIKNCLLLLNDGGGIKCYGKNSNNSTWKNNFISNIPGNLEGTYKKNNDFHALGIYLDELSTGMNIINNTLVNCGTAGIGMNAGIGNNIDNNICFNNFSGLYFYQNEYLCKNNIIRKNVVAGFDENQYSVFIKAMKNITIPGQFINNYYFSEENVKNFKVTGGRITEDYSFEEWKIFVKSDLNSISDDSPEDIYPKLLTNMSDDSLRVILEPNYRYKDVNNVSINGSAVVEPWSSRILLVNGDQRKIPELNLGGRNLNFDKIKGVEKSSAMWYYITGNFLDSPVSITSPEGFEISLSEESGFSKMLSVPVINGSIDRIIYVRFKPDSKRKYYDYIQNKSGKLTGKIKATGNAN